MPVDRIPSDKAATSTDSGRLDSWKEIAGYIGRDERTAQRWRRLYGMPVHHSPGHGRGRVYAIRRELDVWLAGSAAAAPARFWPRVALSLLALATALLALFRLGE